MAYDSHPLLHTRRNLLDAPGYRAGDHWILLRPVSSCYPAAPSHWGAGTQEVGLEKVRELCSWGGDLFPSPPAPHVLFFHKASNPGEIPVRPPTPAMANNKYTLHFLQIQICKYNLKSNTNQDASPYDSSPSFI